MGFQEKQLFRRVFHRVTDGDGAVWAHAFLDAEEVTNIILSLGSIRLKPLAWTAVDMYPAAYKVHGSHSELDECS